MAFRTHNFPDFCFLLSMEVSRALFVAQISMGMVLELLLFIISFKWRDMDAAGD